MNQQQRGRGHGGPRLVLKVADPYRDGDKWAVRATSQIERDGKAVTEKDQKRTFCVDGGAVEEAETNELGVAEATLALNGPGTHEIYAVDQKTGLSRNARVKITEEKKAPKKPAELLVGTVGRNGKYQVTITVLDENGFAIPKVTVRLTDEKNDPQVEDKDTDERGTITISKEFGDNERVIGVLVLGTNLHKNKKLYGARSS